MTDPAPSNIGDARARFTTATMRIRSNRTVGFGRPDEKILEECGYRDFNEYWDVAMSQEMKTSDFVRLLECHLLDPGRTADQIFGRKMRIGLLIEASLEEAWKNGEGWFVGASTDFSKSRLRSRGAAMWLLARPLHKDRLPATLHAYLESERPEGGEVEHRGAARDSEGGRRGGRTRERRDEVMKILRAKYPPDGQPPKGRPLLQILGEVNLELKTANYEPVDKSTLVRALRDLKSPTHLRQMK